MEGILTSSNAYLKTGSGVAQAGSEAAANSGRWIKLTKDSSQNLKLGTAMKGSSDGLSRAIVTGDKGKITNILEYVNPSSAGPILTNPAILSGAAGIMAQFAMQQTMDEITDYLQTIDEKVDDILRAQKDAQISQLIGVGSTVDSVMTQREHTNRVSDVMWSKVQGASETVATVQGYALRQLDALAEKLEKKQHRVGELADVASTATGSVEEWLAILARCFQLYDALAILELDRVMDAEPAELESYRKGLKAARDRRRTQIAGTTGKLLARIDAVAKTANDKTLLRPFKAGGAVRSSNEVATDIIIFNERIGIDSSRDDIAAKRWVAAVAEARDKTFETGSEGVDAVRRFGVRTFGSAKAAKGRLNRAISDRIAQRRSDKEDGKSTDLDLEPGQ
ncbi:hypothetical protein [Citricoccus sp. NR2]|uniref:hypothetical protein n=1 Tax=Citricoccus sp. NR2 TaxID=3004095 RepID=UPI0022DD295C|nr:hypothetical protein [Citricoccus sp. NR2]WBL18855.1 hypothetical protein O1A05_14020 [Citricoccus sp. NR2]